MTLAIHKPIYTYCHNLFISALGDRHIKVSESIAKMKHRYPMLYKYPGSYEELTRITGTELATLKKLGWISPIFNQNFIIWYKLDGTVQLIPVDLTKHTMLKQTSLSNDIPFAYKYVNSHQSVGGKLCIVESPVDAIVLLDAGVLAIATGGTFVHESHLKYMSKLQGLEWVFVSKSDAISAANTFCRQAGQLGKESYVLTIDSWEALFRQTDIRLYIDKNQLRTEVVLVNRIIEKRRKITGLDVEDELISTAQSLSTNLRSRFVEYAKSKGFVLHPAVNYSHALQFAADLIKADISVKEAISTTYRRFGVKINLSN